MSLEKGVILTDEDGKKFFVYNTVRYKEKDYAVCVECNNPKNTTAFEYKYEDDELMIRKEENEKDIQIIFAYSLKNGGKN